MKQITVYVRPSVDVPWWYTIQPEEVKTHYKQTYEDPGHRVEERFIESEDGLRLTHEAEWAKTSAPFDEISSMWMNDPIVNQWKETRQLYCDNVGITRFPTTIIWRDTSNTEKTMVTG